MVWELRITADGDDPGRIALEGRLSAATTPRFAAALADAIAAGQRRIMLDLNGLDYISSGGILAIEATAARLRTAGGWLCLTGAQPAVRVALELAGVDLPPEGGGHP